MCSELCKDFYVVYQLEMVAGEVENSCQLVVTFFFFFCFGLTLPNYRNKSGSAQRSPPSYQLLPPPLVINIFYTCIDMCENTSVFAHFLQKIMSVTLEQKLDGFLQLHNVLNLLL